MEMMKAEKHILMQVIYIPVYAFKNIPLHERGEGGTVDQNQGHHHHYLFPIHYSVKSTTVMQTQDSFLVTWS